MTQRLWTLSQFAQSLEERLDGVMRGQVRFQDLPPAVAAWFFAGEAYGRASRQPEIDRLERDVNRLYNLAFTTPQQRRDAIDKKLSHALEHAPEEQWQQLDRDLTEMAGRVPTIDPAPNAEIAGTHGRSSRTTRPRSQAA